MAELVQRRPFQSWARTDHTALAIRAGARRIAALNQLRTQTKNPLHAAPRTAMTPDFVRADLQHSVEHLAAQIAHLRRQVRDLIAAEARGQALFDLLVRVTGIATATAIQRMGELLVMLRDLKAKPWVALAGLNPREHQSGASVRKPPRLSKAGNRYLRVVLYTGRRSAPPGTTRLCVVTIGT